jgi:ABC-type glycerol-3-phosphate transport system substrate-binding protein
MDVTSAGRASTGVALLAGLGLLAGCGDSAAGGTGTAAPAVTVQAGGDEITVEPTQYCLDGDGQRYQVSAPILEVTPDTTIRLTVSDAVAEAGWSVQVFDEKLQEQLGEVDVPEGAAQYDQITTSDVVPPTFYLVVVEHSDPEACRGLSGAWPVGFIRTDGTAATTSPSPAG